jgi:CubicO group peptidase (beta-lactamase class C family)
MRRKILAAAVFLCALTCHAFAPNSVRAQCAPEQTITLTPDKSKQVDDLITNFVEDNRAGAAVLIIQNGQKQHQKGYGLSDIERRMPICSDTVFDLASVSKQFTAIAILMLKDKGLLNLDRSIRDIFTEPKFPEWAKDITVRHLLNHTSGLPNYDDIFYGDSKEESYKSKQEALDKVFNKVSAKIDLNWPRKSKPEGEAVIEPTSAEALRLIALQERPRFPAGKRWEYSNTGYMMLAQIVEKISGQKFADFMKENVFQPLGMSATFVLDERQKNGPVNPKRATSYDRGWKEYHEIDYTPLNYIYGDGNVNTNLEDMHKWAQALEVMLRPDIHLEERPLISSQTIAEIFKLNTKDAYLLDETTNIPNTKYGYGWYAGRARGLQLIWHAGGWAGFKTMIMHFPSARFAVILLSNNLKFPMYGMAFKIARIYLEASVMSPLRRVTVRTAEIRMLAKRYPLGSKDFYDVTLESDGTLAVKTSSHEKYRLVPESNREFFIEGFEGYDLFRYSFKDGAVDVLPETKVIKQQQRVQ